jgi:hypothetical protein
MKINPPISLNDNEKAALRKVMDRIPKIRVSIEMPVKREKTPWFKWGQKKEYPY